MSKNRQTKVPAQTSEPGRQQTLAELALATFRAGYETKGATDSAKQKKEGTYVLVARLFNMHPAPAALIGALEQVESDYRAGLLKDCPVILGKPDKTGAASPVLPGSYRTAKSTLTDAIELKVKLPADSSYGAIYKAVKEAKDKAKAAAMTDADKARAAILADLASIAASIKDGSVPARRFDAITVAVKALMAASDHDTTAAASSADPVAELVQMAA
jgi:hypothetical protein